MGAANESSHHPNTSNTTNIGSVTGPVHTGSGDIQMGDLYAGGMATSKDEFLEALKALRTALETLGRQGLPADIADRSSAEIAAVEQEVRTDQIDGESITERLQRVKAFFTAGVGLAKEVTTGAVAINTIAPLLDNAIRVASKAFL